MLVHERCTSSERAPSRALLGKRAVEKGKEKGEEEKEEEEKGRDRRRENKRERDRRGGEGNDRAGGNDEESRSE